MYLKRCVEVTWSESEGEEQAPREEVMRMRVRTRGGREKNMFGVRASEKVLKEFDL